MLKTERLIKKAKRLVVRRDAATRVAVALKETEKEKDMALALKEKEKEVALKHARFECEFELNAVKDEMLREIPRCFCMVLRVLACISHYEVWSLWTCLDTRPGQTMCTCSTTWVNFRPSRMATLWSIWTWQRHMSQ